MPVLALLSAILSAGSTIATVTTVTDPNLYSTVYPTHNLSGAYKLVDTYDASNFWSKFDFITEPDPTHGFVQYLDKAEAEARGLIHTEDEHTAVLRVDHTTRISGTDLTGKGRASVRIESKASYGEGLIIADFSHLPSKRCGAWPAFWTYGREPSWPNGGEIDIYEQWNLYSFNRQSLHMNATTAGDCSLAVSHNALNPVMTNWNFTSNCNTIFPDNTGCSTWDYSSPLAHPDGGIFALELSPKTNILALWTWRHDDDLPDNLFQNPHPSTWGPPGLLVGSSHPRGRSSCNITAAFAKQTIVLDVTLCGDTAGGSGEWIFGSGCAAETGFNTCERFVAARPEEFEDVWFGVRSIQVYQMG